MLSHSHARVGWAGVLLAGGVTFWAGAAAAQVPVDSTETWSAPGTAGWSNSAAVVTLGNPGGCLALTHRAQSAPAFAEDIARVPVEPGVRVTNIALRFAAGAAAPSNLRLCLHAMRSGRLWYVPLPRPAAGTEQAYAVPVALSAGWRAGLHTPPEVFADDVSLVDWVGVAVTRNADIAAQEYRLDDFRLRGVYVADLDGDGIPNAWELGYGLDPQNGGDGAADADGDRASNYAEYRAGTRPDDAASVFRVEIGVTNTAPAEKRVRLQWRSSPERTYAVWTADALGATFTRLQGGIAATPATNVFCAAAASNAPCGFYRVEVEPPPGL